MPMDAVVLVDAAVGWLVQVLGTAGARAGTRLTVGSQDERTLRRAMAAALESVVEQAPQATREGLRATLSERFSQPPRFAVDGRSRISDALRYGIREQLEPLADRTVTGSGSSYLEEVGVDAVWLAEAISGAMIQAIVQTAAASGALAPLAAQLNAEANEDTQAAQLAVLHELAEDVATKPWPLPAQLPPPPTDFTGRDRELAVLQAALSGGTPEVVVVSAIAGKPGVGKSVHFAHQRAPHFPDGQLYVDLRGTGEVERLGPAEVLGQFLRGLGIPGRDIPDGITERAGLYRSRLSGRRVLLLLDNAFDEEQVRPLLPGSPSCLVLVTSRRPLAALDTTSALVLDVLADDEALALLSRLADPVRLSAEPEAAAELARLCGRLPLALRIVGARLRTRPQWRLADLRQRLANEHRRLAELRLGDLNVRASFMLSYRELAPEQARLFRRLSVVPGRTFDVVHATAVDTQMLVGPGSEFLRELIDTGLLPLPLPLWTGEDADGMRDRVDARLEALADAQLIEPTGSPGRYRFHDLLRLFAHERLRDEGQEGEEAGALLAFLFWAAFVAQSTRLWTEVGSEPPPGAGRAAFATRQEAMEWLEREQESLVAAVGLACALQVDDWAIMLSEALAAFFRARGYWADWRVTSELALDAARRNGDRAAQARLLDVLGTWYQDRHRFAEAAARLEECVALRTAADAAEPRARTLASLAHAYVFLGRLEEAEARLTEAERLLPPSPDQHQPWQVIAAGVVATTRALLLEHQGRIQQACWHLERARELCQLVGDKYGQATCLAHLGRLYRERGWTRRSIQCLEEAHALGRAGVLNPVTKADIVYNLACARYTSGDHATALRLFDQAVATYHRLQLPAYEARVLFDQGVALASLQRLDAAEECWAKAEEALEGVEPATADKLRAAFATQRPERRMSQHRATARRSRRPAKPKPKRRRRRRG
jgi:tetratricopeptide (TPR) repeat protein